MHPRVSLILLAALCGAAMAREPPMSPAANGRELLQTSADCGRSISNCKTCRYQKFGTTTLTVCSQCDTGYVVKNGGRACWCAAGFKKSGSSCVPCGNGLAAGTYAYCPGSKATFESGTSTNCGANKLTNTDVAKSEKECVAAPGYGWVAGDGVAAVACDAGSYNPGQNTRKCTKCPGGLTTAAGGSTAASACLAPAGYYYYRGKAVACAQGTYKPAISNADCTACPTGFTTTATASTAATDCTVLKAGFSAPAGAAGTAVGAPCAADTYRTTDAAWDSTAVSSGIACDLCPTGCATNGVVGASSSSMCLTPPGYGWTGTVCSACAVGKYNTGYNLEACTDCPSGFATDLNGTVSSDGCKVPAGYGTTRDASGVLSAAACPVNTYGRNTATYGLVDVECTKCIDNTGTNSATGSTSSAACVTDVGFGYDDGAANLCDYSYWSSGLSTAPCTYCGDGKNTSNPSTPTVPSTGGQAIGWCVTAAGWTLDGAGPGVKPCIKGTYKSALGNAACTTCSTSGLTTSVAYGAAQREDCDTCLPGYGTVAGGNVMSNGTFISLTTSACTQCVSGKYSAGGVQGGALCDSCPVPADYNGDMVSRPGSTTSDACVRQFPTSDTSLTNNLEWDILPMDPSALTNQTGITTVDACQAACKGDAGCQYFAFYNYAGGDQCFLRTGGALVKITADVKAPSSTFYVMFEVKEGQYAAYPAASSADAAAIGTTIATFSSFDAAKTACDGNVACAGFTNTADASWRTFKGVKWADAVGKVRAVGETINSWVA